MSPDVEIPDDARSIPFADACEALGICENTGLKLARDGRIKSFKIGRCHRVTIADLQEAIAAFKRVPLPAPERKARS